jgi:Cu-processing system permease protein
MKKIVKITFFGIQDVLRSKWGIMYGLLFLLVTEGLFQLGGHPAKVILSLTNITLALVPLISAIFGTMYFYNSREFVELLLTQPVRRSTVYTGLFISLTFSLVLGFIAGVSIPYFLRGMPGEWGLSTYLLLMISGTCLTCIFVGLSFLVSLLFEDRGKGLGLVILTWLFFAILYDGAVMFVVNAFSDYPLEKPMIAMAMLNPIDLARIVLLIQTDISALMGYTGAVFERFFGTLLGSSLSLTFLILWSILPFGLGLMRFKRKDF